MLYYRINKKERKIKKNDEKKLNIENKYINTKHTKRKYQDYPTYFYLYFIILCRIRNF